MLRLLACLLMLSSVLTGCEDDRRRVRTDASRPPPSIDSGRVAFDSGGFDSGRVDSGGFDSGRVDLRDAGPPTTTCIQSDLGSRLGVVSSGTTTGRVSSHSPSCSSGTAGDIGFTWTAPSSGTFTFATEGSDFDTVLEVLDGGSCSGFSLECDDDGGSSATSVATVSLTSGQRVVVIVDGYSSNEGSYTLTISSGGL